jgi:hypothetical protein
MSRMRENPIGEQIYNRIKEYDMTSRKVFLKTLSTEHRELYNKYSAVLRKRNSLKKEENKEKANIAAREGMKTLRSTRPKEQQKEQRKPYDTKYELKRKMTRTEAATVIQKQYKQSKAQKQKKEEATAVAKDILNDILNVVPNLKIFNNVLKPKRGRKIK